MPPENCLDAGSVVCSAKHGSRSSVSPGVPPNSATRLLVFDERELNLLGLSDEEEEEEEGAHRVLWILRFAASVLVFLPSSP